MMEAQIGSMGSKGCVWYVQDEDLLRFCMALLSRTEVSAHSLSWDAMQSVSLLSILRLPNVTWLFLDFMIVVHVARLLKVQ